MPLECVTYLGMLPINDKNANDPDTLNVRDDKYALNLERCLSSGRITFELGIDDNVGVEYYWLSIFTYPYPSYSPTLTFAEENQIATFATTSTIRRAMPPTVLST